MGFRKRDPETGQVLPWLLNTRTFMNHTLYAPYVYIPLACAACWLTALLAMMGLWVAAGKPRYTDDEPSTVFISNVAGKHKWVFVPLVACVCGLYVASLMCERALRAADRLPHDIRRRTIWLGWLSVVFAAMGGAALILLGVFDCFSHSNVHWSMACVFIVCVAISAILQTGQVWSLHKDHPHRKSLFRNSIWKLFFVVTAVAGAISFAACYGVCRGDNKARGKRTRHQCDLISSAAAALEWTIAFILFFYFLTLAGDMWPSSKYSRRYQRRLTAWREKQGWVAPPAAVATHDQVAGLNTYHNAEPIDQWETVTPMDAEPGYPTTTAYGKPVQDFYDSEEHVPRQYAQGPADWEFVNQQQQPQYHPQQREYPTLDGQPSFPPQTAVAAPIAAQYQQNAGYPQQTGTYPQQQNAPSRYATQTYTSQPVPPPGHPEQPPATYQPTGERIDPQLGWQQHASWRGTCTPQDVAGFQAPRSTATSPVSPGPTGGGHRLRADREVRIDKEVIQPPNAY